MLSTKGSELLNSILRIWNLVCRTVLHTYNASLNRLHHGKTLYNSPLRSCRIGLLGDSNVQLDNHELPMMTHTRLQRNLEIYLFMTTTVRCLSAWSPSGHLAWFLTSVVKTFLLRVKNHSKMIFFLVAFPKATVLWIFTYTSLHFAAFLLCSFNCFFWTSRANSVILLDHIIRDKDRVVCVFEVDYLTTFWIEIAGFLDFSTAMDVASFGVLSWNPKLRLCLWGMSTSCIVITTVTVSKTDLPFQDTAERHWSKIAQSWNFQSLRIIRRTIILHQILQNLILRLLICDFSQSIVWECFLWRKLEYFERRLANWSVQDLFMKLQEV